MIETKKEIITKAINKIVNPLGCSFRWRTTRDQLGWNGVFFSTTMKIILKSTARPQTLAHELAHLTQFNLHGRTKCEYSKYYPNSIADEHYALQKQWIAKLKQIGLYQLMEAH